MCATLKTDFSDLFNYWGLHVARKYTVAVWPVILWLITIVYVAF